VHDMETLVRSLQGTIHRMIAVDPSDHVLWARTHLHRLLC
jgi:hypothetical protein